MTPPRSYFDPLCRVFTDMENVESMTRQDQAEHVNINNVYCKLLTGQLPAGAPSLPEYGDYTQSTDYDKALTMINDAHMAFMDLPAEERRHYDNNVSKWYEATLADAQERLDARTAKEADEQAQLAEQTALENARKVVQKAEKAETPT